MSSRLLLIGLDAADWKIFHPLIDAGEMPAFSRLLESGASGELLAPQPLVPALLLTSLVTGKRAWQHGLCHGAELAPDGRQLTAITAARRKAAPLWQMLAHAGKRSVLVGWPGTHGDQVTGATIVSDRFPEPTAGPGIRPWPPAATGTYWPGEIGKNLDARRVSPENIGANVIAQYIPDWKQIDQKRDHRIGQLRLFLAADYSYQTAALESLKQSLWDFAAIHFPALAPILRLFLAHHLLPPDQRDQESATYHQVVRTACRILDNMIRQLIEIAGPGAAVMVISAHGARIQGVPRSGFPPGDKESWKSPYGIFVASGPNFAPDAILHGAGILDIAPTILTWFGLPIGDDMEGRVLMEGFANLPEVTRVDSWESHLGISIDKSVAPPAASDTPVAAGLLREADWNFVQSCLDAARYAEALPVLDRLFREFPERVEVAHALFQCQLALGQVTEAAGTLEVALESLPAGIASLLPRAELALAQRNWGLARSLVQEAYQLNSTNHLALRKLGVLLLRLREWDALAKVAQSALARNGQDAIAWLGLAAAQLRLGKASEATAAATRAIQLKFFLPDAHFILARASLAEGKWAEAREAMQTLLKLQPDNRAAAKYFSRLPRLED